MAEPAANFTKDGALKLPENYREWVFLGATVEPQDINFGAAYSPGIKHTYMDPESFAHWKKTGSFRTGTVIVQERLDTKPEKFMNATGYFGGKYLGLQAMVKDPDRYPDNGLPDLVFAGGTRPAVVYRNRSAVGGSLSFERVKNSGLDITSVSGVYPLDIDGDKIVDLVVLRVGENLLMRGRGDCTFERANKAWGFNGGNADGRLDLVVTNRYVPARIWRNLGNVGGGNGNWLKVTLKQPGGNHSAIGAWVEVRTSAGVQRRENFVGGGHAGGQWGTLHFGLGAARAAKVRVQWPGGEWGQWVKVRANRPVIIERKKNSTTP